MSIARLFGNRGSFLAQKIPNCTLSVANYSSGDVTAPVKMAYTLYEDAPVDKTAPLVVMHGLFGSKQNWRGTSRALQPKIKRKIYTLDARNHGESPHVDKHNSKEMAADVVEFLRQHGHSKAAVMGHSMGGRTAMHLALKHPHLVERCVVIDISPIAVPRDFMAIEKIFVAMKKISIPADLTMAKGRQKAEEKLSTVIEDEETVKFISLNLKKRDSGEFYWSVNLDALYKNLRLFSSFLDEVSHLPSYEGPVLFICGTKSNFVDPASWPAIKKIFPNASLQWLDAGHLVHYDQPEKFLAMVVEFLNK